MRSFFAAIRRFFRRWGDNIAAQEAAVDRWETGLGSDPYALDEIGYWETTHTAWDN